MRWWRAFWPAVLLVAVVVVCTPTAWGQMAAATQAASAPATMPVVAAPADYYGGWVFLPPLITIVLAIVLRQVIPALGTGILVAGYMLVVVPGHGEGPVIVGGLRQALEGFVLHAIGDMDHVKIIVFTFFIGGMVGVIGASGGTAAIVGAVARWASDRRRGQVVTWLAGLLVFFDDYANAMIVGPSMRPVCDRLRISRAKLAYLVDSTAAPVSSIALIGTWIGAEVGFIHDGLRALESQPAFLQDVPLNIGFAYNAFLLSIPYRFYPILALVMVLLIALLNRDFGPMLKAEREAQVPDASTEGPSEQGQQKGKAWYAGVPVVLLVVVTLALLFVTGWANVPAGEGELSGLELVQAIVSNGDSYNAILYGSLAALVSAAAIALGTGALRLGETVDSATAVMGRMLPTMVVLVLAWSLSSAMQELELGEVAERMLHALSFDARWLPLLIFITAAVVSFATGTSWGTMGILCPAAVTIVAGLLETTPAAEAWPLFYASVGSVLAGAVFGDHCSPISDTTVLSSLASECTLESHVWTQMPYALVVAAVSIGSGEVLCRAVGLSPWIGLGVGTVALVLILLVFGRRPERVTT